MAGKMLAIVAALFLVANAAPNASIAAKDDNVMAEFKFLAARSGPAADADSSASLESTSAAMEAALTDLMLGKTAFGATPMGGSVKQIMHLITKDMMPKVIHAHKTDQATLIRLAKDIKKCGSVKDASLKSSKPSYSDYLKNSKYHKGCRNNEAVLYSSKMTCLNNQRADYRTKVLKCDFFATVSKNYGTQKANFAIMKKAGAETTQGYIERISNTICGKHIHGVKGQKKGKGGWGGGLSGGFLDKYLRAKDACQKAKAAYAARVKECTRKTHAYSVKKGKCNQYQGLMDASSCKSAVLVKDACETYAGCYYAKVQAYKITEKKVRSEEVDRKAEWRGLKRMECLIKAFADGKVSHKEVDACKGSSYKAVATQHLSIKYPPIPPLKSCNLPTLFPATGAYKRREFSPLPNLAKGVACAPCGGMVVIAKTPRAGSPKGAKCERVALNGFYSAGAMVKCTGGHDVRRSYDKNSCPLGTKIFAPASRGDWKTFLASAGPLRNPHWIIDVTRPANSCGGCKSYSMNSNNRQQKSWRTSDGSPWWLRSTKYSEPNGDYHANCFLNLGNAGNENSVTFNDGNCNYHSKSYYCQPINLKLKPKKGSPRSCHCSKVDLAGSYTAGLLVKCEQCLNVYKSTQKNSCPQGMKIFSPASRNDWKTFLNSATPLRAPHWIIDVTRPQNGCGGCKKYSMKSSTPQQATWKTSDSSPWWLRSTRFNEPNGDYKANCYLNLNYNPPSADTVRFNDYNCNRHSRSYYCQPSKNNKLYALKGAKAPKIVKKKGGVCKASKGNGVGGCFAGGGKSKKENAKLACESVYGAGQCTTKACGSCNNRGYHGKGVPNPCNGATMWNFKDDSPALSCGWRKCQEVIVSRDGGKNWRASCGNKKFVIVPANKKPLCRRDACVPSPFNGNGFGIKRNFPVSKLKDAGFLVWSNHEYGHHTTRGEIQPTKGDCVVWGSKQTNGHANFHVVAMGRRNKVHNGGSKGKPVKENGAWWYTVFPRSNGVAPNNKISLNSADTNGSGDQNKRLSWHLHRGSNVGGWRSGTTKYLNSNKVWRKVVMYGPCNVAR